jgi:hypothetical protein
MPDYVDPSEAPDFRDWAADPEHDVLVDALAAEFVAEEGVEMVADLLAARGPQHQWVAERWMNRLRDRFERWWADGQPRFPLNKRVAISYLLSGPDQEARRMLETNLPPGATFALTRKWRRPVGAAAAEPAGCACRIDDGAAVAAGQGETPAAAAQRALDAWREFVTGCRVQVEDGGATELRPPLLDAPSADPADTDEDGGRANAAG